MKFTELDLNPQILEAIDYMGFEEMTPVQEQAIPLIMKGRDLIACAQTGTGKTAAFIIPILDRIIGRDIRGINTLIIVPTRELALQIDQHIQGLAYFSPVNSLAVYGGGDGIGFDQERTALESDTAIIVATPGKLISHLNMGYANFGNLEHLILDEADKMLDMGFFEDIRKIISFLPGKRQSLMFSATMPHNIRKLAKHIMTDHAEITLELAKPAEGVLQAAYFVFDNQKTGLITSLLKDKQGYDRILIFTSTKSKVNDIVRALKREGFNVKGISSDLQQKDREEVLLQFKAKNVNVLVATDVLSRGIDIKDIDLVINYDVPVDAEDYVHRVGRTARASSTGVAITFINDTETGKFRKIEELIERKIMKLPLPGELGKGPDPSVRTVFSGRRKFTGRKGTSQKK